MRETILAILALSLVTTMSLGIMSASVQNSMKQVDREIEVFGSAVAVSVLDYIGSLSYDQRTTPNEFRASFVSKDDSTQWDLEANFGMPGIQCNLSEPWNSAVICDDLDDVDMDTLWQPYNYLVNTKDSITVPFEINTNVTYVIESQPDSTLGAGVLTHTKKVTVLVQSLQHKLSGRAGGHIVMSRLISYNTDTEQARSAAAVQVCDAGGIDRWVDKVLVPIYVSNGATSGPC